MEKTIMLFIILSNPSICKAQFNNCFMSGDTSGHSSWCGDNVKEEADMKDPNVIMENAIKFIEKHNRMVWDPMTWTVPATASPQSTALAQTPSAVPVPVPVPPVLAPLSPSQSVGLAPTAPLLPLPPPAPESLSGAEPFPTPPPLPLQGVPITTTSLLFTLPMSEYGSNTEDALVPLLTSRFLPPPANGADAEVKVSSQGLRTLQGVPIAQGSLSLYPYGLKPLGATNEHDNPENAQRDLFQQQLGFQNRPVSEYRFQGVPRLLQVPTLESRVVPENAQGAAAQKFQGFEDQTAPMKHHLSGPPSFLELPSLQSLPEHSNPARGNNVYDTTLFSVSHPEQLFDSPVNPAVRRSLRPTRLTLNRSPAEFASREELVYNDRYNAKAFSKPTVRPTILVMNSSIAPIRYSRFNKKIL